MAATWIISGHGGGAWEWANPKNRIGFASDAEADAFAAEREAAGDRIVDDRKATEGPFNVWD